MKTYNKPEMEVVEIEKKDILTASTDVTTNTGSSGGIPGLPDHGGSGNADAGC